MLSTANSIEGLHCRVKAFNHTYNQKILCETKMDDAREPQQLSLLDFWGFPLPQSFSSPSCMLRVLLDAHLFFSRKLLASDLPRTHSRAAPTLKRDKWRILGRYRRLFCLRKQKDTFAPSSPTHVPLTGNASSFTTTARIHPCQPLQNLVYEYEAGTRYGSTRILNHCYTFAPNALSQRSSCPLGHIPFVQKRDRSSNPRA